MSPTDPLCPCGARGCPNAAQLAAQFAPKRRKRR